MIEAAGRLEELLQLLRQQADRVRSADAEPLIAGDPALIDMLIADVVRRRQVEAELAGAKAWLDLAQEAGGVGAYECNPSARTLTWSRSIFALYGIETDQTPTLERWLAVVHPEDRERVAETARRAIEQGVHPGQTYRILRRDGAVRWVEDRGRAMMNERGEVDRLLGINIDVTEMHEAHEQKLLLMNELSHRVKNIIASVQAMARQTLKGKVDDTVRDAFEGRLLAMAHAHEILTEQSWRSAEVSEVVARVLRPHSGADGRFRVQGTPAELEPQAALALAMALHELCTNASKYGSLSVQQGYVRLAWRVETDEGAPIVHLTWAEAEGPPVRAPQRTGFGSRMIQQAFGFDPDASVRMEYAPGGLRCDVRLRAKPNLTRPVDPTVASGLSMLEPEEREALEELVQLVIARAANGLAGLLDEQVIVSAPSVRAATRSEAVQLLGGAATEMSAVQQAFDGELAGRALLILPQPSAADLVSVLLEEPTDLDAPLAADALAEVGNVVLQSALSTMANLLGRPFEVTLPMLLKGGAADVLGAAEPGAVLFIQVDFSARNQNLRGYILLLLNLRSRSDLKDLAARYISRASIHSPAQLR